MASSTLAHNGLARIKTRRRGDCLSGDGTRLAFQRGREDRELELTLGTVCMIAGPAHWRERRRRSILRKSTRPLWMEIGGLMALMHCRAVDGRRGDGRERGYEVVNS